MRVDREPSDRGVFVSLYGPATSNGCHMAKENRREVEKWIKTLQTFTKFDEIKRNRIRFILNIHY